MAERTGRERMLYAGSIPAIAPPFNSEGIMKLEDQIVSLVLAKKLQDISVTKESWFYWVKMSNDNSAIHSFKDIWTHGATDKIIAPAYTVAELWEMLPGSFYSEDYKKAYYLASEKMEDEDVPYIISYEDNNGDVYFANYPENPARLYHWKEADLRAEMLIYLIENNLIDLKLIQQAKGE